MNDTVNTQSKSRLLGRLLRFFLGVFFVTEVWPVYMEVTAQGAVIRVSWAIGLVLFYLLMHLVTVKFVSGIHPLVGSILAFAPFLSVFFIGYGGPAATGALTFLAVSLILASIRADPGCEVMSVPAMVAGKHTHLCCLLFSPIDWCESKFYN